MIPVHVAVYELLVGAVPEGLQLDHLCRVRHCCNPRHLEPVTGKENVRRGIVSAYQRSIPLWMTHCRRGHEFTPENTYVPPSGQRVCRSCLRAAQARWYRKAGRRATVSDMAQEASLTLRLPIDLYNALKARAAVEYRPISQVIRMALQEYLQPSQTSHERPTVEARPLEDVRAPVASRPVARTDRAPEVGKRGAIDAGEARVPRATPAPPPLRREVVTHFKGQKP
jgi:hypothetical protein